ncbi:hypothetical protein [Mycobacterium sp. NPDC006124]|uniref:WXG100-like domain-containing protein n=1 Tax=Mycobacterium sp. NPDC006124 TaxID=3156729 RepID=UPI0033AF7D27
MTAPISVDPSALAAIGSTVGGDGDATAAAVGALDAGLSGAGAMFGHDAAGLLFAQGYTAAGKAILDAAASVVNAGRRVGFGIQTSAANYGHANASSTVGGGSSPVPAPAAPAAFTAPGMPPPLGAGIGAPLGWSLVESFVGDVWPDGNPGELRTAAGAWKSFGTKLSGLAGQFEGAGPGLSSQQIPEAGQITDALGKISGGLTEIAAEAQKLAASVDGFAGTVEATQDAVRNLLHQLSPSGVLETISGIFSGHDPLDEIRKIAHEIKTVLNNMKREADASMQLFNQGINALDSATDSLEKWATKEFTSVLGKDVGGALAFEFTAMVDGSEGALKFVAETAQGISQLDPTRFLYDPSGAAKTWEGLGEAAQVLVNPTSLVQKVVSDPQGSLDTVKGIVDWKDVEAGHPLRAVGYDVAQVGSFVIPGVGEADAAADGAGIAGRTASVEERAAAGAVREGVTGAASESVASQAGRVAKDLDGIGVPESSAPVAAPGEGAPAGRPPVDTLAPSADAPGRAPVDTPAPHANSPEPSATEPVSPASAEPPPPHDSPVAPHGDAGPPASHGAEPAHIAESNPSRPPNGSLDSAPSAGEPSVAASRGGELPSSAGADDKVPASVGAHASDAGEGGGGGGHGSGGSGHGADGGSHGSHGSHGSSTVDHEGSHGPNGNPEPPMADGDAVRTAHDLNDAFSNELPTEDLARQVADGATHHVGDSDRVVLGKYDGQDGGYIGEAKNHGGIYYDTGPDVWDAIGHGLSPEQSKVLGWKVNEQFLRMQMEHQVSRIEYVLPDGFDSVDQVARVRRETFSALEINFLNENAARFGYVREGNSWVLKNHG